MRGVRSSSSLQIQSSKISPRTYLQLQSHQNTALEDFSAQSAVSGPNTNAQGAGYGIAR